MEVTADGLLGLDEGHFPLDVRLGVDHVALGEDKTARQDVEAQLNRAQNSFNVSISIS